MDSIKNYPDDSADPIEVMRKKMSDEVEKLLAPVKSIIRDGDDVFEELSQGFNAQLYFSLLRDETLGDGIYFVDQPEDQMSLKPRAQLYLRLMAGNRSASIKRA